MALCLSFNCVVCMIIIVYYILYIYTHTNICYTNMYISIYVPVHFCTCKRVWNTLQSFKKKLLYQLTRYRRKCPFCCNILQVRRCLKRLDEIRFWLIFSLWTFEFVHSCIIEKDEMFICLIWFIMLRLKIKYHRIVKLKFDNTSWCHMVKMQI